MIIGIDKNRYELWNDLCQLIISINEIDKDHYEMWGDLFQLAISINEKNSNWLTRCPDYLISDHILAATIDDGRPIGFLRFTMRPLGAGEATMSIAFKGRALTEAKVETFGVAANYRNQGIGRALQFTAIRMARMMNCYQLRSESPYGAIENYHLKLSLGFGVQPRLKRKSVYFIKVL
jgi:GNAT superfamily N-acetyltransferase